MKKFDWEGFLDGNLEVFVSNKSEFHDFLCKSVKGCGGLRITTKNMDFSLPIIFCFKNKIIKNPRRVFWSEYMDEVKYTELFVEDLLNMDGEKVCVNIQFPEQAVESFFCTVDIKAKVLKNEDGPLVTFNSVGSEFVTVTDKEPSWEKEHIPIMGFAEIIEKENKKS